MGFFKDSSAAISEANGGFEEIAVNETAALSLTVPGSANRCEITINASATQTDLNKVVRYKQNGTAPAIGEGVILGHLDTIEIIGKEDLANFQLIGIEVAQTHEITVQYFTDA